MGTCQSTHFSSDGRLSVQEPGFLTLPAKDITSAAGSGPQLHYAMACMQGYRTSMEDAHVLHLFPRAGCALFGVLDGHSGAAVAHATEQRLPHTLSSHLPALLEELHDATVQPPPEVAAVEQALRGAFLQHDVALAADPSLGEEAGGCTCASVFVSPSHVTFAHLGDSRAVLVRNGRVAHATRDHKPSEAAESRRIYGAGGMVVMDRVDGTLAVSRAFGDFGFKGRTDLPRTQQKVSPEPDLHTLPRDASAFEFVLIACDGVWDVMTTAAASAFVHTQLTKRKASPEQACRRLVDRCLKLRSLDNISAMVVVLRSPPPPPLSGPPPAVVTCLGSLDHAASGPAGDSNPAHLPCTHAPFSPQLSTCSTSSFSTTSTASYSSSSASAAPSPAPLSPAHAAADLLVAQAVTEAVHHVVREAQ